ncbi:protein ARMCX6 [Perognathus longimembris pacificus]|uniref:protein ARMCX6 n=1 Tax=Perognathus longimembris pacificus TaxID=214514 RepID=UPI00201967AB|nr:protein ARMCX6 [Perognathus longimembris pacificus]XP_048192933.1 protein ARMCX6 [Perognathus longimembris pacificus]
MGRAREVGWMAAGLMIGAGACYCVYKLTIGREDSDKLEEEEEDEWDDDLEMDEEEKEIWFDLTTMARPWSEDGDWNEPGTPGGSEDRPSGGGKANRAHPIKQRPFPYEHKKMWSVQSFKIFTCILDLSKCPSIQGKMFLGELKAAGFPLNHSVNSYLASFSVTGNTISPVHSTVKEKAPGAPNHLKASTTNQGQIKMYFDEVCQETVSQCCNSLLQQAGLHLLISMTVINNMLAKSVSDLKFPLISEGSRCAKIQALEPPMALSEKPDLEGELLGVQMLCSFLALCITRGSRQILQETLVP